MIKKMLVADYDGTLKSDLKNLMINIESIKAFRKKGNLFTISTGRSYESIKRECEKYNIPYDFINCFDGSVLYDEDDNLIFSDTLSRQELIALSVTYPAEKSIVSADYYDSKGLVEFNKYDIDAEELSSIVLIDFKLKLFKTAREYTSGFKHSYPNIKFTNLSGNLFVKNDFDKSRGLQVLEEYLRGEIHRDNIITVGDNSNDIEMLRDYDGYKMLSSYPCMYGRNFKTTREVHTLIKKISR